jgi:hypothetical protein
MKAHLLLLLFSLTLLSGCKVVKTNPPLSAEKAANKVISTQYISYSVSGQNIALTNTSEEQISIRCIYRGTVGEVTQWINVLNPKESISRPSYINGSLYIQNSRGMLVEFVRVTNSG